MATEAYWIDNAGPGRLGIMPRPRGGDWLRDECAALRVAGVNTVVSLLQQHEAEEFDLAEEGTAVEAAGMRFLRLPIADMGVPERSDQVEDLVANIEALLKTGGCVVIHCRQGIGRSSLIAACALRHLDITPEEAFARIATARGVPVPETEGQREWVGRFFNTSRR
jgi:protein-tyrosine phosphatase